MKAHWRARRKSSCSAFTSFVRPDTVEIHSGLALIATVGRGMVRSKGISARLFNALMKAGVNVRLIDQGSSELNIIVGVDNLDFEVATRAIYRAFVTKDNRW